MVKKNNYGVKPPFKLTLNDLLSKNDPMKTLSLISPELSSKSRTETIFKTENPINDTKPNLKKNQVARLNFK